VIRGPIRAVLGGHGRSTAGRWCRLQRVAGRALRVPAGWAFGRPFLRPAAAGWKPVVGSGQESVDGRCRPHTTSLPEGAGDWGREGANREGAVIPMRSSVVRAHVRFATVADRRVATMSRSRGRVIRVPAPDPSFVRGGRTQLAGLYVGASRSETDSAGDDVRRRGSCRAKSAVDLQLSSGTCADMWSVVVGELQHRRIRCSSRRRAFPAPCRPSGMENRRRAGEAPET
jgi:hypothetical protein